MPHMSTPVVFLDGLVGEVDWGQMTDLVKPVNGKRVLDERLFVQACEVNDQHYCNIPGTLSLTDE